MSDYKDKLAKARKKTVREGNTFYFKDEHSEDILNSLIDVKTQLESLETAVGNNTEKFDIETTNKLLEDNLDKVISLHKQGGDEFKTLAASIVKQIAELQINVNVPEQKQAIVNKIVVQDWRKEYMFSDSDKGKTITFVGFVSPTGSWYIEKVTKGDTSDNARFAFGSSDYVSNWGKHKQLTYEYLFEAYPNGRN